jgi:hypothetical protein
MADKFLQRSLLFPQVHSCRATELATPKAIMMGRLWLCHTQTARRDCIDPAGALEFLCTLGGRFKAMGARCIEFHSHLKHGKQVLPPA